MMTKIMFCMRERTTLVISYGTRYLSPLEMSDYNVVWGYPCSMERCCVDFYHLVSLKVSIYIKKSQEWVEWKWNYENTKKNWAINSNFVISWELWHSFIYQLLNYICGKFVMIRVTQGKLWSGHYSIFRWKMEGQTDRTKCTRSAGKIYILTSMSVWLVWKSIDCTNTRCICVPNLVKMCQSIHELC